MSRRLPHLAAGLLAWIPALAVDDAWDRIGDALRWSSADNRWHAQAEAQLSVAYFQNQQENPGFVFTEHRSLLNPRLAVFLDAQAGDRVSGFVQLRADRGFDPADKGGECRLDEYAVRVRLGDGDACQLQAGQFANVIGNWVQRHDAWQNPFVNAPLPYEYMTGIYDGQAPHSAGDLVLGTDEDLYEYNPVVWGPGYSTGLMVAGRLGKFEYAVEIKNAGPSSRPEDWPASATNFSHPACNLHLEFRPDLRWRFGVSASDSVYLMPRAAPTLPAGRRLGDYRERLLAQDVSFEWHHLQLWAELFEVEFVTPGLPRVWTVAGYVEARYKFTPQLSGALRLNRQVFSSVENGSQRTPWGTDLSRLDAAALYRFNEHMQLKLQLSTIEPTHVRGHAGTSFAAEYTIRF